MPAGRKKVVIPIKKSKPSTVYTPLCLSSVHSKQLEQEEKDKEKEKEKEGNNRESYGKIGNGEEKTNSNIYNIKINTINNHNLISLNSHESLLSHPLLFSPTKHPPLSLIPPLPLVSIHLTPPLESNSFLNSTFSPSSSLNSLPLSELQEQISKDPLLLLDEELPQSDDLILLSNKKRKKVEATYTQRESNTESSVTSTEIDIHHRNRSSIPTPILFNQTIEEMSISSDFNTNVLPLNPASVPPHSPSSPGSHIFSTPSFPLPSMSSSPSYLYNIIPSPSSSPSLDFDPSSIPLEDWFDPYEELIKAQKERQEEEEEIEKEGKDNEEYDGENIQLTSPLSYALNHSLDDRTIDIEYEVDVEGRSGRERRKVTTGGQIAEEDDQVDENALTQVESSEIWYERMEREERERKTKNILL